MSIYGMEVDRVVAVNNLIGVYPPAQTAFGSLISVEAALATPFLVSGSATIEASMSASG